MRGTHTGVVLATALAASAAPGQVEVLTDGGFETTAPVTGDVIPGLGVWFQDLCAFVGADRGITPAEGARMLRFDATLATGGGGRGSDVWQVVSVEGYADEIDTGRARVDATILCNRVAGDALTDTLFQWSLYAIDVLPATATEIVALATGRAQAMLLSDGDTGTWEPIAGALDLPIGTRFVAWAVSAVENVHDTATMEFDGHYADAGSLVLRVSEACPADLDGDGVLTIFDFLMFQNLFDAGDPRADFDGDGSLTIFDFLAFQNAFDAGCP